jgi:hypothetical protein
VGRPLGDVVALADVSPGRGRATLPPPDDVGRDAALDAGRDAPALDVGRDAPALDVRDAPALDVGRELDPTASKKSPSKDEFM